MEGGESEEEMEESRGRVGKVVANQFRCHVGISHHVVSRSPYKENKARVVGL